MKKPFLVLFSVLFFFLLSFNFGYAQQADDDKFIVVLDAGHGGHDPGNLGNGYFEKNIALNIVLKVGRVLEQNPDIKVIYTRKDDTFIDLYVRGEIANKANADLFVSVHCDSHTSDAQGAGTFVLGLHANKQNFEIAKKENSVIYLEDNYESRYANYDINSPESVIGLTIMQEEFLDQSIALAKMIQDNFSGKLKRTDRKVKQAGFIVLHQTFMPSVLVETGFLTNKKEGSYLNSKKGQAEIGEAISDAILDYKKSVQSNTSFTGMAGSIPSTPELPSGDVKDKKEAKKAAPSITPLKSTAPVTKKTKEVTPPPPPVVEKPIVVREKPTKEESKSQETVKPHDLKKANDKKDLIFKVQIFASSKDLPLSPDFFNGLNKITKEPVNNLYRYLYGSTNSISEAKLLKSNADLNGYKSSYIVGYRNGVRIPAKEVAKYVSE
ncbi:N-acetylmuramoyl-L-alanine amidase family protein [Kriegella aquimaris]|uniref:N-acetylmuramoyl-L-alanine amidase n=1 Tax=Kriegella aquimaris TaxID=192904 RepID=A0A1G9JTA7_9FLAO|nr:N-acetylmuramoyl-L-alanine amidase [Kriegella aquimaris]SDL40622.1 N-acetylmuramoyl-L-alanine amidase [Kriegella aquimaris]